MSGSSLPKPKLHDVARAAEVGTTTVSRVLHNHPNISARTRQRVLSAIETLGYTPDRAARAFRSGQTQAVSVLLPMIGTPFYRELLGAVDAALDAEGYDTALFPLMGPARVRRYRDPGALVYRADALLIASQNPDDLYDGRPPFRQPTVLVDACHPQYHSVSFDNHAGGRLAAHHAARQELPVVFLDGADHAEAPGSPVFAERRAGVLAGLRDAGAAPALTLRVTISHEGLRGAAEALLARRPAGPFFVLAMSDELALGLHSHLQSAGLDPRHDYGLIGFDGSAAAAQAGVASIVQPVRQMGEAAAEVLLAAMRGETQGLDQRRYAPELRPGTLFQAARP